MKKVLIVDDAKVARMVLRKILEKAGCKVVAEATNGLDAVEKYKQLGPDIVTMDIVMPEMDGIESTREIKKIDPNAKVIITSTMHQKDLLQQAFDAGASSYVVKPYENDRILRTIDNVFHGKAIDGK